MTISTSLSISSTSIMSINYCWKYSVNLTSISVKILGYLPLNLFNSDAKRCNKCLALASCTGTSIVFSKNLYMKTTPPSILSIVTLSLLNKSNKFLSISILRFGFSLFNLSICVRYN